MSLRDTRKSFSLSIKEKVRQPKENTMRKILKVKTLQLDKLVQSIKKSKMRRF
jgi:hypothetical protein